MQDPKLHMMMKLFCIFGSLALLMPAAHSLSRVVLRNGSEMNCDHFEQTTDKLRIYTMPQSSNFIEIPTSQVLRIDSITAEEAPELVAANTTPALPPEKSLRQPAPELTKADLDLMLADAGSKHNVDADLLASIVHAESGGHPNAVSHAGAQGLMQLMPATATQVGVKDAMDPSDNVHGGTAYIDNMLTRYHGNLSLALAAYNAGPAAVDYYHGIPPYRETRAYVARVIHEFNRRVDERNRVKSTPPRTQLANQAAR